MKYSGLKGEIWKEYIDGYYFSNLGRVKHVYKNSKERILNPFVHKSSGKVLVKIHSKSVTLARVIYELFVGPIPKGYSVIHRNKIRTDNELVNLQLASPQKCGQHYGNSNRKAIIYNVTDDCYYKSTREAAKALHISRQTVSDYCNKKTKNPMFNLKWVKR